MRIFSELQKRVMDHGVTADSIQMMTNHIIYSKLILGYQSHYQKWNRLYSKSAISADKVSC